MTIFEILRNKGIPAPFQDTETFRIIRWGKNKRYWLKKFDGGYIFGDFVRGVSEYAFDQEYKGKRLEVAKEKMRQALAETENEQKTIHENTAQKAQSIWNEAKHVSKHPYLARKKVLSHGLKEYKGNIVIPLYDIEGKLWSLQFIDKKGQKRFLSGGKKKSCLFTLGDLKSPVRAFICEGYATGATIHECTAEPTVIAFDAGNLKPVVQSIREKYPNLKMVICADDDQYGEVNIGLQKAQEAANIREVSIARPVFIDTGTHPTDFNDLFILEGKNAVIKQIEKAKNICAPSFQLTEDGLFYIDEKDNKRIKICSYIEVKAFIKESDSSISRLIEFRDYKKRKCETILISKMFANNGDQAKVHLISKGFIMKWSGLEKRKLIEYLLTSVPSNEITIVESTGYCNDTYVRPDGVIGGNKKQVMLSPEAKDEAFATSGTLDDWIKNISAYCSGNSRLMFSASLAFASLLLKPCNLQSGGFHLASTSSTGKTTCLRVASSIFGSPQYLKTWRATDNALESIAFKRNDALLVLDELSEMSSQKAGSVAYMFSHGEGKDRLGKDCNLRTTFHWRMMFLSSGEVDLAAHLSEVDNKSKAGQEMRFISIPSNAINRTNGVFENLHEFSDVSEATCRCSQRFAPRGMKKENIMKNNDLSVIKKVMQLQDMNMRELTKTWHTLFDHEPDVASQRYMIEKLAYRIQELAYGGLDTETDGKIKACEKEITKKNAAPVSKKSHKFCPMIGTKIVKEYKGKTHEVMVVNDGFSYDGTVFRSLSAIATKIAGTKWNGLKIFRCRSVKWRRKL